MAAGGKDDGGEEEGTGGRSSRWKDGATAVIKRSGGG